MLLKIKVVNVVKFILTYIYFYIQDLADKQIFKKNLVLSAFESMDKVTGTEQEIG